MSEERLMAVLLIMFVLGVIGSVWTTEIRISALEEKVEILENETSRPTNNN